MSVIRATGLTKHYGDVTALDGFDLNLEPGRIVGLIGPNGSGKTTAIKTLLGLCHLDGGTLEVLGLDPVRQRKTLMARTAYIADTGILPRWMKVKDLIDFVEGVHPSFDRSRAEAALARTDVRAGKKVLTLSKGMQVQLHLSLILAIDAELLVLDEPTLGLDILYRQQFYDTLLNDYFNDQRSILITTHEVREIEHLLTDVVFIDRGRQALSLETDEISRKFSKLLVTPSNRPRAQALGPLSERPSLQGVEYIFKDVPHDTLKDIGEISIPNLAELFVATVGAAQGGQS